MQIEFQKTFQDFRAAEKAYRRSSGVWAIWGPLWSVLCPALFITMALVDNPGLGAPPRSLRDPLLFVYLGILVAIALPFLVFWAQEIRYKTAWQGAPALQRFEKWDVSESGIVVDASISRSELEWAVFQRWFENSAIILLFVSKKGFVILPKRAFADDNQMNEFRDLLQRHIQPQTHGFPVINTMRTQ